jgi:glycosyltransferase involved in cell wall biosynthesis
MTEIRVAVFAHSHPALSKGGAEIIAQRSFLQLGQVCAHSSLFAVAQNGSYRGGSVFARDERIVEYDRNEFLIHVQDYDGFLGTTDDWQLLEEIANICREKEINVFHIHHFFKLGINAGAYLRSRFPNAAFVFTLHEYLSVCYQNGQMIKRNSRLLCDRASPIDCHLCFPEHSKEEFQLRASQFVQMFSVFHAITSPSKFLADRISAAGLTDNVRVVRNGTSGFENTNTSHTSKASLRRKFAFFGQTTPFKGLDVYLRSAVALLDQHGSIASFSIFGCDAESVRSMPGCLDLISALEKWSGNIFFRGVYDPRRVITLMQEFGWIVVPSIWWENSPVVIQEAFLAGRPVLCSGIGGMKEAVTDEHDGLHFRPNDPSDLAEKFERCLTDAELWPRLQAAVKPPRTVDRMNADYIEIYREIHRSLSGSAA